RSRTALATALVVLIALTPILGVLAGLNEIRTSIEEIALGESERLKTDVISYMLLSTTLLVSAATALAAITAARLDSVAGLTPRFFATPGVSLGVAMILLFTTAVTVWPTALSWMLGTQALVYLFLAALTFVLAWFSHVFRRSGWPVT